MSLEITRKRRTREHVIADLSVNHVERVCLKAGYSVQRMTVDYGIDLLVMTHDRYGFIQEGWLPIQVKATDHLHVLENGKEISLSVDRRDLNLWVKQTYPVILVAYDGRTDKAYWLNVKAYLASVEWEFRAFLNIRIPLTNRWNIPALRKIAAIKDMMVASDSEVPHDG